MDAASRAHEAQEEKAASAPSHCHGVSKPTHDRRPVVVPASKVGRSAIAAIDETWQRKTGGGGDKKKKA